MVTFARRSGSNGHGRVQPIRGRKCYPGVVENFDRCTQFGFICRGELTSREFVSSLVHDLLSRNVPTSTSTIGRVLRAITVNGRREHYHSVATTKENAFANSSAPEAFPRGTICPVPS